jgi:hypothetical protein
MNYYHEMLQSKSSYTIPREQLTLLDFLYPNKYKGQKDKRTWADKLSGDNSFVQYLKKPKAAGVVDDIREALIALYCDKILGEDVVLTTKQHSQFLTAAKMLSNYMKKKRLEKIIKDAGWADYAAALFSAVYAEWGQRMYVGNLCSKSNFTEVLPRYIRSQYEEV